MPSGEPTQDAVLRRLLSERLRIAELRIGLLQAALRFYKDAYDDGTVARAVLGEEEE